MSDKTNVFLENIRHAINHDITAVFRRNDSLVNLLKQTIATKDIEKQSTILNLLLASNKSGLNKSVAIHDLLKVELAHLTFHWVDIAPFVSAQIKRLELDTKQICELQLSSLPLIKTDTLLFNLAIEKLLENAFYFHRSDSALKLQISYCSTKNIVTIDDNNGRLDGCNLEYFKDLFKQSHTPELNSSRVGAGLAVASLIFQKLEIPFEIKQTKEGVCISLTFQSENIRYNEKHDNI